LTIKADRMTVFYLDKDGDQVDAGDLGARLDKIVIEGNVRISQKDSLATGRQAIYYRSDNKVVLTGEPRVQRGKDVIKGNSITVFIDSEKSIVEGGPSGPVEAIIFSPGGLGGSVDQDSVGGRANSGTGGKEDG
jgi:lipopolysaccharide export system protein LptA